MLASEEIFFFGGKAGELGLYQHLTARMEQELAPFERRVQKTQISFYHTGMFACVSLKWKNCLVVSFGLPDRVISPRIYQTVEIRPGRWTHHVKVFSPAEIDGELLGWLNAASHFASR